MKNIDIERLIDAVEEENNAYFDYAKSSKNLYKGALSELEKRRDHVKYCRQYHDRQQTAIQTIIEVFNLDREQVERLYISARAMRHWRIQTNYARLIPDTMQKQIEQFIFG